MKKLIATVLILGITAALGACGKKPIEATPENVSEVIEEEQSNNGSQTQSIPANQNANTKGSSSQGSLYAEFDDESEANNANSDTNNNIDNENSASNNTDNTNDKSNNVNDDTQINNNQQDVQIIDGNTDNSSPSSQETPKTPSETPAQSVDPVDPNRAKKIDELFNKLNQQ